jgi:hypothetical protein
MDTSSGLGLGDVDNEVADLAVEVVLVGVPVGAITTGDVWVGIDHTHALETS